MKLASLFDQAFDQRVRLLEQGIEPGKIEPDLQVEIILIGKIARRVQQVVVGYAETPPVEQAPVAGIGFDHRIPVRHERVLEQKELIFERKSGRRFQRDREKRVGRAVADIVVDLLQKGRHKVEGLMDVRKIGQQRRHIIIILDAVHADPGKDIRSRKVVLIVRLVHVPYKGYGKRVIGHDTGMSSPFSDAGPAERIKPDQPDRLVIFFSTA